MVTKDDKCTDYVLLLVGKPNDFGNIFIYGEIVVEIPFWRCTVP